MCSAEETRPGHVHSDEGLLNDPIGPVPVVRCHPLHLRLQVIFLRQNVLP